MRSKTAGCLFVGGAGLGSLSLVFAGPEVNVAGFAAVVASAFLVGLSLLAVGDRLPVWSFQLAPALGTVHIAALVYFRQGGAGDPYAFLFVFAGLWACYFLSIRAAALQISFMGVVYAVVLTLGPPASSPIEHWLMTIGTVSISGGLAAWLAAQLRERATQMSMLLDASRELAAASDPERARPIICEALLRFSGASVTALYEPNPEGSALVASASAGKPLDPKPLPFVGSRSVTAKAFGSAEAIFVAAVEDDPRIDRDMQRATGARSGLWQPVLRHGEPVAVLVVLWETPVRRLPGSVSELAAMLAAEAATTIDRAELMGRLEAIARTDDLTGLLNRRAWDAELVRETERSKRLGSPFCVAMLDLDNFKEHNDRHGHPSGDRLLKHSAAAWRSRLRVTDTLARYGGDEFALIILAAEIGEAAKLSEKLCAALSDGQTCSIGVAQWDGEESPQRLAGRADEALYAAKNAGRACVVVA